MQARAEVRPIQPFDGVRLRVRRVDESAVLRECIADAVAHPGSIRILTRHGGGVANCYGYRAETEYAVALAVVYAYDDIRVMLRVGRVRANKVTHCGCWRAATGYPLCHTQMTETRRESMLLELVQCAK